MHATFAKRESDRETGRIAKNRKTLLPRIDLYVTANRAFRDRVFDPRTPLPAHC